LKTLGVATQLIVYPGEGHLFIKPEHQVDRMEQMVGWFDKYLED
jgi:dipeptidyl aminopeptidase/acylaminoacyl peptidase